MTWIFCIFFWLLIAIMSHSVFKPKKSANAKKMVVFSDEELVAKEELMDNKNMLKHECSAQIAFDKFLEQAGVESHEYWLYSDQELCKWLRKFWFGVRRENVEYLKINSLRYKMKKKKTN